MTAPQHLAWQNRTHRPTQPRRPHYLGLTMTIEEQYESIKPTRWQRIYDLVKAADVEVGFWEESKITGKDIDPYRNTFQNSRWTFGGGAQPLVACIWWTEMIAVEDSIVRKNSSRAC
jgi:hypothetical protein